MSESQKRNDTPTEPRTYTGGCHCGQVRYQVTLALDRVMTCNCSICSKTGTLLAFAPAEQFALLSGEEALTDYQFHRNHIHHLFCSRCGIRSFVGGTDRQGRELRGINVRCLDGVDLDALELTRVDGRSL
jgi:hypothetical protein